MNKLKIIVFGILTLFLPLIVNADMGAPYVLEYEAYVNKPDGVKYYNGDFKEIGTLPYNKKLKIIYEYDNNGVFYGNFSENNELYYVKLDDLTTIKEQFDLSDESVIKITEDAYAYVLIKNLSVHSGPAEAYEIIGKIPEMTNIKYLYTIESEESPWKYIEYEGIKGWISELGGSVGYDNNEQSLRVKDDLDIVDSNNAKIGILPKDTILKKDDYYSLDIWSKKINHKTYIKNYKGLKGYVQGEFYVNRKAGIELSEDSKLYKDPQYYYEENKNYYNLTIPKGTILESDYYTDDYFYYHVKYENQEGWIPFDLVGNNEIYVPIEEYPESTEESTEDENNEEENKKAPKLSGLKLVIFCISAAIILGASAYVTIDLINSKRS